MTDNFHIEPTDAGDFGPCSCGGTETRRAWGFVHSATGTVAAYFVQWAIGRVADHGALFDLILGAWGEGTSAADRVLVTLDYRLTDTGPAFMVVESASRPAAASELVGRALARAEVIGQPVAAQAFEVADAVLARDVRIVELLGSYRMGPGPGKRWWQFWR